ncbi:hypothetical protein FQA39_LY03069 [Lamprigera yunnana]|nr:hypothetical protein FQA39_LY03069 [Lamprigera yunnana]
MDFRYLSISTFLFFTSAHPGGAMWIDLTKGTDITEAFEAHHISSLPEEMLKKYYIRKASKPRNSPFTFKEDGFYRTLKRNAQIALRDVSRDASHVSNLIIDALLSGTFIFAILACKYSSFVFAVASSFLLALTTVAAHNYFHKKDNFRMYYFNLSLMDFRYLSISTFLFFTSAHPGGPTWIELTKGTDITEAFEAHHLSSFPEEMLKKYFVKQATKPRNSPFTFEEDGFYRTLKRNVRPALQKIPKKTSNISDLIIDSLFVSTFACAIFACKYGSLIFANVSAICLTFTTSRRNVPEKAIFKLDRRHTFFLAICHVCTIRASLIDVLKMWLFIISLGSFVFGMIGVNAAHHHPEIFHEGDAPRSRGNIDWGLFQLDAVSDRYEITGNTFLVLTNFGDHALHHMFPTLDHSTLKYLYPIFEATMEKFGVNLRMKSQMELVAGQFRQLSRETPNMVPPGSHNN